MGDTSSLPHYYFNLKKEKKNGEMGESSWTPATSLILALAEALKYVKQIGMANLVANAQMLALATRAAAQRLELGIFARHSAGNHEVRILRRFGRWAIYEEVSSAADYGSFESIDRGHEIIELAARLAPS